MKKKKLLEMRAAKQKRMKEILEAATNEERALNTEERDEFGTLEEEIRGIDETIKAMESMRNLEKEPEEPKKRRKKPGRKRSGNIRKLLTWNSK